MKYAKLEPNAPVSLPLGVPDWSIAFGARSMVRQALRDAAIRRGLTSDPEKGMGQYQDDLKTYLDPDLDAMICAFRGATYYVEWFTDVRTNRDFANAMGSV